jgi:hypothetical protein
VVAVGAAGEQTQVGVGGLGTGVGQAVLDGVEDQLTVFLDGLGQLGERGQAAALGPGQPSCEQGGRGGRVTGLEDCPELFF